MNVRDNIRKYIQDKGLTQAVMARRAGLTPTKLSMALQNKRKLDVDEFIRLCEAMGVTTEEIQAYGSKRA